MAARYEFICIPLDARPQSVARNTFELTIVTHLQFTPQTVIDPQAVQRAALAHPLLAGPDEASLVGYIWDYSLWSAQRALDVARATRVTLRPLGPGTRRDMRAMLVAYLTGGSAPITTSNVDHDDRPERLPTDHFVSVTKAADEFRLLTHALHLSALRSIDQVLQARTAVGTLMQSRQHQMASMDSVPTVSLPLARWVQGAAHSAVLESLSADAPSVNIQAALGAQASLVSGLRTAAGRVRRRLSAPADDSAPACDPGQLNRVAPGQPQAVDPGDPNVAIQAALKTPLLASACGLVTRWAVECPVAIDGNRDYVIQLEQDTLAVDSSALIELAPSTPTVFRRSLGTHPSAFADVGRSETGNGLLAHLNEADGTPRYRASSINTETQIVKDLILQSNNTLGTGNNPDAPRILSREQFGQSEPETSGLTFAAPEEDLVLPATLRAFSTPDARKQNLPCLFLDDLWIGYRLDVKNETKSAFASVHRTQQRIVLRRSGTSLSGWSEDYFEREQLDDASLGHSSTDIGAFTGLSTGQAQDLLRLLGTSPGVVTRANQPFDVETIGYSPTERLLFGHVYKYRLRNVFLGGVSCDTTDRNLETFPAAHEQRVPFFRARALRAGEVLYALPADATQAADGQPIVLTHKRRTATVALVPSPLNIDASRFHGVFLMHANESEAHRARKHVADLGKFFGSVPPKELNYFYDPDVHGVVVRATLVNGDDGAPPEDLVYVESSFCRVSAHVHLDPIAQEYGPRGEWQRFRPIVVTFRTSNGRSPRIRRRRTSGNPGIEVSVPAGCELHLSFRPLVESNDTRRSAAHVASSAQLVQFEALAQLGLDGGLPTPAIAEQTLRVVYATEQPRATPTFVALPPRAVPSANVEETPAIAKRAVDSEYAQIVGRIELDAASTKEVRLEAKWSDINDDPAQPMFSLQAGQASMSPKSIAFRPYEPARPSADLFRAMFLSTDAQGLPALANFRVGSTQYGFIDQFGLQCSEDKVFLGHAPFSDAPEDATGRINFGDQRRKLASVEAVALSRFGIYFPAARSIERRSSGTIVDVPSGVRMSAPQVDHVVPLRWADVARRTNGAQRSATYGLRVYVRRPCFSSGPGERVAIGCAVEARATGRADGHVDKYVTQWGEDPIERAGLRSTMRMPRASDFVAPSAAEPGTDEVAAELYPSGAIGGRAPVIYSDNIAVAPPDGGTTRNISVASYLMRFDSRKRLWFFDVFVGSEFFGWCGLALYRHQPHSLHLRELSPSCQWVYAAVLYGEPVAWVKKADVLSVTVGPVFDANLSFELDSLRYRGGVSDDVRSAARSTTRLQSYRVGNASYFEASVRGDERDWELVKRRFGRLIGSLPLSH